MINKRLKKYIEKNIFPENDKNDAAHNMEHINYVINRSLKFAKEVPNINLDMVYTIAAYHDITHHINEKSHEIKSAEILYNDKELKQHFNDEEMKVMKEAIEDHRASSKNNPRNIYGKIVSSADRNTDIPTLLKRTYSYRLEHYPNDSLDKIIEDSRKHIIEKYCQGGYAENKMFFHDKDYKKFLVDINNLCNNEELFVRMYKEANKIDHDI